MHSDSSLENIHLAALIHLFIFSVSHLMCLSRIASLYIHGQDPLTASSIWILGETNLFSTLWVALHLSPWQPDPSSAGRSIDSLLSEAQPSFSASSSRLLTLPSSIHYCPLAGLKNRELSSFPRKKYNSDFSGKTVCLSTSLRGGKSKHIVQDVPFNPSHILI